MQKRYATDLADAGQPESPPADVVRVPPGDFVQGHGKSFQMTRRWEYRRQERPASDPLMTDAELEALGSEGWELAGVVPYGDRTWYYFKRSRGG